MSSAIALAKPRSTGGVLLFPPKSNPSQVAQSPGNWQHPRIKEITHRQNATVFGAHNVKAIVYNVAAIIIIHLLRLATAEFGPPQLNTPQARLYVYWAFMATQGLPLLNITLACLPLVRSQDDLSDIPLTPAQRKLLGLSPSAAPQTANSVYSTPPRYSRTPSVGKPSPTSSPLSINDSPASGSRLIGSPYSPAASAVSPLLQKALGYSGGLRISSYGLQSPLNTSTNSFNLSTDSSIFSEPPPTPTPVGGKRTSVGLNNKWLYDRSRRSSGHIWP